MSSKARRRHSSDDDDDSSPDNDPRRRPNRSRSRSPHRDTFREPERKQNKPLTNPKIVPLKPNGIKLKLGGSGSSSTINSLKPVAKKLSVAKAFCADDSDEEEEMPAECKMRMKNIGRNTPTSSGPNSFGKTKHGFCDQKKLFEKLTKKTGGTEED